MNGSDHGVRESQLTHLAHKIELDPTAAQREYFARACGVARFSYNWALAEWNRQYKEGGKPNVYALVKLQNATKDANWPWMREVCKSAPQYAIHNLGAAFKRFFAKLARRPKFKRKGERDSFRAAEKEADVSLKGCRVRLPRIGWIRMREALRFTGKILFVTVSRTADRWFASFLVETEIKPIARENQAAIGVDLGIKNLATLSDGTVFENPKALRSNLGKLKRLQRSMSRKKKRSANRAKAKVKLARLHYRIKCIRKYAIDQVTSYLTKNFGRIGAESLNVKGMLKNRKLSQAISDVGFGEFGRQLEYKAALYGSTVVWASRWFPSSKTCHVCGSINDSLTLRDREWGCKECGTHHDRDANASNNLKILAEKSSVSACGEVVRLDSVKRTSVKQELSAKKVG